MYLFFIAGFRSLSTFFLELIGCYSKEKEKLVAAVRRTLSHLGSHAFHFAFDQKMAKGALGKITPPPLCLRRVLTQTDRNAGKPGHALGLAWTRAKFVNMTLVHHREPSCRNNLR